MQLLNLFGNFNRQYVHNLCWLVTFWCVCVSEKELVLGMLQQATCDSSARHQQPQFPITAQSEPQLQTRRKRRMTRWSFPNHMIKPMIKYRDWVYSTILNIIITHIPIPLCHYGVLFRLHHGHTEQTVLIVVVSLCYPKVIYSIWGKFLVFRVSYAAASVDFQIKITRVQFTLQKFRKFRVICFFEQKVKFVNKLKHSPLNEYKKNKDRK